MNTQKLTEAIKNYKECYKEAKRYTSYEDVENADSVFIVRELKEKSWKYEDAKFPVVLGGLLIVFIYLLVTDLAITDRNILIDACVLFSLLIGGILVELNLTYWMNKYMYLAKNLEKAEKTLDKVREEYIRTPREYREGMEPFYKSYITLFEEELK